MLSNKYDILNKSIYNALSMKFRIGYEIMLLKFIYDREKIWEIKDKTIIYYLKMLWFCKL